MIAALLPSRRLRGEDRAKRLDLLICLALSLLTGPAIFLESDVCISSIILLADIGTGKCMLLDIYPQKATNRRPPRVLSHLTAAFVLLLPHPVELLMPTLLRTIALFRPCGMVQNHVSTPSPKPHHFHIYHQNQNPHDPFPYKLLPREHILLFHSRNRSRLAERVGRMQTNQRKRLCLTPRSITKPFRVPSHLPSCCHPSLPIFPFFVCSPDFPMAPSFSLCTPHTL